MRQAFAPGGMIPTPAPLIVDVIVPTKTCQLCGATKVLDDFSKRRASKDGKQSHCRDCQRREQFDYRARWKRTRKVVPARKACRRCDTTKPAAEFSASSASPDGLQSWCKSCQADYHIARKGSAT